MILHLLANVQQATIKPLIQAGVALGSLINTDEDTIYDRLPQWGFAHKVVNHSRDEYARDGDGDGFCEVHVNAMERIWSLLRSWLRPHRGISQAKLPCYLALFEFVQTPDAAVRPCSVPFWVLCCPPPRNTNRALIKLPG